MSDEPCVCDTPFTCLAKEHNVTDSPSPADLADSEEIVRHAIAAGNVPAVYYSLPIVMANYTRLQAVERAAAELVHHWSWEGLAHDMSKPERRAWIAERDRLEDRLRALLTAGPHQTGPENEES